MDSPKKTHFIATGEENWCSSCPKTSFDHQNHLDHPREEESQNKSHVNLAWFKAAPGKCLVTGKENGQFVLREGVYRLSFRYATLCCVMMNNITLYLVPLPRLPFLLKEFNSHKDILSGKLVNERVQQYQKSPV